jgi:hypothetical protein
MNYSLEDKYRLIKEEVLKSKSKNPIEIVKSLMHKEFINIHGPEHHFLDGACLMITYKNAGGNINIESALDVLSERTIKMPGAMCGYWGVCGSSTSVGAALSVIHDVSPLSSSNYYKDNMEYTSLVIKKMSEIGGPRCCKRNAFIALSEAVKFIKDKYGIRMEFSDIDCEFSFKNKQCIGLKCPFYKG